MRTEDPVKVFERIAKKCGPSIEFYDSHKAYDEEMEHRFTDLHIEPASGKELKSFLREIQKPKMRELWGNEEDKNFDRAKGIKR